MSHSITTDPNTRKVLLVLTEGEYERCEYETPDLIYNPELTILPYPMSSNKALSASTQQLLSRNPLSPGTLYIQSPFDLDHYEDAISSAKRFAIRKHMIFKRFCQALGATKVIIKEVQVKHQSLINAAGAGGSKSGVSVNGDVYKEEEKSLKEELSTKAVFAGQPPDTKSAEAILRENRLLFEPTMKNLLEMRSSTHNILKSDMYRVDLSMEARENLKIGAKITFPSFLSLSADYSRAFKETFNYNLVVSVSFENPAKSR